MISLENFVVARGNYCCRKRRHWYNQHQMSKLYWVWKERQWEDKFDFKGCFLYLHLLCLTVWWVALCVCLKMVTRSKKLVMQNLCMHVWPCVNFTPFWVFLPLFLCICFSFWGLPTFTPICLLFFGFCFLYSMCLFQTFELWKF
jgi:hypothetical protein